MWLVIILDPELMSEGLDPQARVAFVSEAEADRFIDSLPINAMEEIGLIAEKVKLESEREARTIIEEDIKESMGDEE